MFTNIFQSNLFHFLHELQSNFEIFSLLNVKTRLCIVPGEGGREGGRERERERERTREREKESQSKKGQTG